jgi:hypothetical protein
MASTPVVGDLVVIGPPTSGSPIGAAGLYLVIAQSGTTVTVTLDHAADAGQRGSGLVVPLSRVLWRYANS